MDIATPTLVLFLAYIAMAAYVIGATITDDICSHPFWGRRIGSTRFRYANLPVGGMAAFALAAAIGCWVSFAFGVGFTAAAVSWAWIAPCGEQPDLDI